MQVICVCTDADIRSGKCSPYYVSTKSNKVNSHVGPGSNYKIRYVYGVYGLPMKIIAKYDTWCKVVDPDGEESWIHKSLLSSKRRVIISSSVNAPIHERSNDSSAIVAYAKKNVVMKLIRVRGNWCEVDLTRDDIKIHGWINRTSVYGVLDSEG
jgi:SH3-like domain-containing protein